MYELMEPVGRHLFMQDSNIEYKIFLKKFILLITILFTLAVLLIYGSMKEPYRAKIVNVTLSENYTDTDVLTDLIARADACSDNTTLIIGDSIANQLFRGLDQADDAINVLTSNAAFMITGQYVVFKHYVENHPECKDVFLIMHPMSLSRNFDYEWSYKYSASVLAKNHCLEDLEPSTVKTIHKMYGYLPLTEPFIYMIQESPICRKLWLNYMSMNREIVPLNSTFELAEIYVKNMFDFCNSKGVTLHLLATPISMSHKEMVENIADDYEESWLSSVFPDYMKDIYYYDDIMSEDKSHFSGEYADREHLDEMIGLVYGNEEILLKMR